MLAEQLPLKNTLNSTKSVDELCSWIDAHIHDQINWVDLIRQSGLDRLTIQAEFSKQKLTTPMTWIRKRREELTGKNVSSVAPSRLFSFLANPPT